MLTEFFLAGRYLKPRRNAVSLITVTSILGVTLGVAVLMVVLAVMTGFTDLMKKKLVETQAHFQVRLPYYTMRDPSNVLAALKEAGASGAPVIQGPALAQYGEHQLDPQVIVFAAPEEELKKHVDIAKMLKSGTFATEGRRAVVSSVMANRWGVRPGDKFLLHSAQKLTSLVRFKAGGGVALADSASAYLPQEFTVAGIYNMGKYDFDRSVVFLNCDDAAELFDLPWGAATAVYGWGPDAFHQDKLIEKLRAALPMYRINTWEENNRQMLGVLAVEKRMMFFLLIFIVLVAAFSIANTLITSVYQKTREIGVLKALGASDTSITHIFVLQGMLIGIIGSCTGTLFGYLVLRFRNDILHLASRIAGCELFPKEFYFFNELPAQIVPGDVIFIVAASVILCTAGALLPALRAARLDPAKALRYE